MCKQLGWLMLKIGRFSYTVFIILSASIHNFKKADGKKIKKEKTTSGVASSVNNTKISISNQDIFFFKNIFIMYKYISSKYTSIRQNLLSTRQ